MGLLSTRTTIFLSLLPAIIISMPGCGGSGYGSNKGTNPPPGNQDPNTVVMAGFAFSPSSLTVAAGDTVTWRNEDNVNHTVTSTNGNELASAVLSHGQTYKHVFHTAGSYPYHCAVHPSMTGTVTVQ